MEDKKVKSIVVNWFYTTDNGEEVALFTVGKKNVQYIDYHEPKGEGDRHYCDVKFEDGTVDRMFNINSITFE